MVMNRRRTILVVVIQTCVRFQRWKLKLRKRLESDGLGRANLHPLPTGTHRMSATEALIHCLACFNNDRDTGKVKGSPSLRSNGSDAFDTRYEPYRATKDPTE
jgi:hypothetical protein